MEPADSDIQGSDNYKLKRSGYEAMQAGDYVRSYYIFLELRILTPNDVDVTNFIAKTEEGLKSLAFFVDETEGLTQNIVNNSAVFSIPSAEGGRAVLRIKSLALGQDSSYAAEFELAVFDEYHKPAFGVKAPLAKCLPVEIGGIQKTTAILNAIDRGDSSLGYKPIWQNFDAAGRGSVPAANQVILDIPYEDFLLAAEAGLLGDASDKGGTSDRGGASNRGVINIVTLYDASKRLGKYGYIAEVFTADIVRTVTEPVMMLSWVLFAVIIGVRYRVQKRRSHYAVLFMFFVLPLVFNAIVHLWRYISNNVVIASIVMLGNAAAFVINVGSATVVFVICIYILAIQKPQIYGD
jgi:hypothetical protein